MDIQSAEYQDAKEPLLDMGKSIMIHHIKNCTRWVSITAVALVVAAIIIFVMRLLFSGSSWAENIFWAALVGTLGLGFITLLKYRISISWRQAFREMSNDVPTPHEVDALVSIVNALQHQDVSRANKLAEYARRHRLLRCWPLERLIDHDWYWYQKH